MRFILPLVLFFSMLIAPKNALAQYFNKGDATLDINYGFPNLISLLFKDQIRNNPSALPNETVGSFGPASARYEYMLSNRIGIGAEFNTANTFVEYIEDQGNNVFYTYKISIPRYRLFPKFLYHFGKQEQFDFYTSVAAGLSILQINIDTNDPDFTDEDVEVAENIFAFRLALGTRFYFKPRTGLSLELGLGGGALAAVGLSFVL